jgi:hypothetical protein
MTLEEIQREREKSLVERHIKNTENDLATSNREESDFNA